LESWYVEKTEEENSYVLFMRWDTQWNWWWEAETRKDILIVTHLSSGQ